MKNECLSVEQPKSNCEHRPNRKKQETADLGVTKGGENRETENTKIGDSPDQGERHSADAGIRATQHLEQSGDPPQTMVSPVKAWTVR